MEVLFVISKHKCHLLWFLIKLAIEGVLGNPTEIRSMQMSSPMTFTHLNRGSWKWRKIFLKFEIYWTRANVRCNSLSLLFKIPCFNCLSKMIESIPYWNCACIFPYFVSESISLPLPWLLLWISCFVLTKESRSALQEFDPDCVWFLRKVLLK